jgi:hypothetical protein
MLIRFSISRGNHGQRGNMLQTHPLSTLAIFGCEVVGDVLVCTRSRNTLLSPELGFPRAERSSPARPVFFGT